MYLAQSTLQSKPNGFPRRLMGLFTSNYKEDERQI